MRSKEHLSVLMLDIDFFKKVNDTYGHNAGDKVINACAKICSKLARSSDIVTRYGGEEFVILLPTTDINEALNLAQRIKDNIAGSDISINDKDFIKVTMSIGTTQINHEADTKVEDIIKRADIALYKAKKRGRNHVESLL